MINKNKITLVVVIVIIIIIIAFFAFKTEEKTPDIIKDGGIEVELTDGSGTANIETIPIDGESLNNSGIVDINNIKGQELDTPNLNRQIVFSDSVSEAVRNIVLSKVATITTLLREDLTSFKNWLDLAIQYKIAGDYEGARDVWEFINETSPTNSVSFHNLGDLYHFNLKDYPKSEENFRKAIENSPQNTQSYGGLHGLYKYSYKQDSNLAESVLLEGIEAVTNNIDLVIALANYYKERGNMSKGDQTNAKKYYEQARDEAEKLGNTQLVETLNEELNNL